MDNVSVIDMRDIHKAFSGVPVLKGVDFALRRGEVHALIGANGAGKSTLVKILNGIYLPDAGEILIEGQRADIRQSSDAEKYGISFVHQELNICPDLTVAENIFVGRLEKTALGFFDEGKTVKKAQELIDMIQVKLDAKALVRPLRAAEKQIIEILKALTMNAKILALDEPTSSLNEREKEVFISIVEKLKKQGVSIIFISHFLEDILRLSDRVTVIKDGVNNGVFNARETDKESLITAMMGKALKAREHKKTSIAAGGVPALELKGLSSGNRFANVNLAVQPGTILGICGLLGAGKSELARTIFGLDPYDSGEIRLFGKTIARPTPQAMMESGVAFLSEDRKTEGFVPLLSIRENETLSIMNKVSNRLGIVNRAKQKKYATELSDRMTVKCSSVEQEVVSLSGGNQQKVIIGRCVAAEPKVFMLDEPTRGVDVYAKAEIYGILADMASKGVAIVIFSSELEELLDVCDEIVALKKGEIVDKVEAKKVDKQTLMHMIS